MFKLLKTGRDEMINKAFRQLSPHVGERIGIGWSHCGLDEN
jgi:hypothetical protein